MPGAFMSTVLATLRVRPPSADARLESRSGAGVTGSAAGSW